MESWAEQVSDDTGEGQTAAMYFGVGNGLFRNAPLLTGGIRGIFCVG